MRPLVSSVCVTGVTALREVHKRGIRILHGDLRPANVLAVPASAAAHGSKHPACVMLVDFNMSKYCSIEAYSGWEEEVNKLHDMFRCLGLDGCLQQTGFF